MPYGAVSGERKGLPSRLLPDLDTLDAILASYRLKGRLGQTGTVLVDTAGLDTARLTADLKRAGFPSFPAPGKLSITYDRQARDPTTARLSPAPGASPPSIGPNLARERRPPVIGPNRAAERALPVMRPARGGGETVVGPNVQAERRPPSLGPAPGPAPLPVRTAQALGTGGTLGALEEAFTGAFQRRDRASYTRLVEMLSRYMGKPHDYVTATLNAYADDVARGTLDPTSPGRAHEAGARAFGDPYRNVTPRALRTATKAAPGVTPAFDYNALSVGDYLLWLGLDPSNFLATLSKGLKLQSIGQAGSKLLAQKGPAIARAARPLADTEAAQALSRGLGSLGLGPTAKMLSEVKRRYQVPLERRVQEAGQIAREMRDWTVRERKADPEFDRIAKAYQAGKHAAPGVQQPVSPLADLVKLYVGLVENKLKHPAEWPPKINANELAWIQREAASRRVPFDVVERFAHRLLQHGETTHQQMRAAGFVPFVRARGHQWEKDLPPGRNLEMHIAGRTPRAKARSEERLRQRWFGEYLNDILVRPPQQRLGDVGSRAFTGSGIREARRAGLGLLANDLAAEGRWLKKFARPEEAPAGWVQVPLHRDFDRFKGYWMPKPLYNYLASELGQSRKVFTKFGRVVGEPDPRGLSGVLEGIERGFLKGAGQLKKNWLASVATAGANTVGNHVLADLGLRREGGNVARFTLELGPALKEIALYRKSGQMSPDVADLNRHSRALLATEASTAGLRPGAAPAEIMGLAGKVVGAGPLKTIFPTPDFTKTAEARRAIDKVLEGGKATTAYAIRPAGWAVDQLVGVHSLSEEVYKLALFKEMRRVMKGDSAKAAAAVEKYLFDYSDRGALLEAADRYGVWIFNTFPTKALGLFVDTLVHRPDLLSRYPRLASAVTSEFPEQAGAEEKAAGYRRGLTTVPASREEPVLRDFERFFPFALPFDQIRAQMKGDRTLPLARELTNTLSQAPAASIFSPLIAQFENRRLFSSPDSPQKIRPPGAPLSSAIELSLGELGRNLMPAQARQIQALLEAHRGETRSTARTGEAPPFEDALLQQILGVPTFRGERLHERKERTGEKVGQRRQVWGEKYDQVDKELWPPPGQAPRRTSRYLGQFDSISDMTALKAMEKEVRDYLSGLATSQINAEGAFIPGGEEELTKTVEMLAAIIERKKAVGEIMRAEEEAKKRAGRVPRP